MYPGNKVPLQRDAAYRELLKALESFEAVWRQQPDNTAALERAQRQLQDRLDALRETFAANAPAAREAKTGALGGPSKPVAPSKAPSSPEEVEKRRKATEGGTYLPGPALGESSSQPKDAKQGSLGKPSGPVRPSQAPSTAGEAARQRNATEQGTYLPGPVLGAAPGDKALAGVPENWLRVQCLSAGNKLAEIGQLLKAPARNQRALAESLAQLHAIITGLSTPPRETGPTFPKSAPPK
jgi:hypothetical protein